MKILMLFVLFPIIMFSQSDGINPDNAVVTLGNLQCDIAFGNDCDEHQLIVTVEGDIELNDKILAIRNAKIKVRGNVKKNGVIINPDEFNNFEQLKFECGSNSVIEIIN